MKEYKIAIFSFLGILFLMLVILGITLFRLPTFRFLNIEFKKLKLSNDNWPSYSLNYKLTEEDWKALKADRYEVNEIYITYIFKNHSFLTVDNVRLQYDNMENLPSEILGTKIDVNSEAPVKVKPFKSRNITFKILVDGRLSCEEIITLLKKVKMTLTRQTKMGDKSIFSGFTLLD